MKNPLKHWRARLRGRWHLAQARRAIARCNRNVARRNRLSRPTTIGSPAFFFAPGVIEASRAPRRGLRPYAITLLVAVASTCVYLARGGLWS